jgi:hypothetical protein
METPIRLYYTRPAEIAPRCHELIRFDMDSVRQMVSADRETEPEIWIVDPDGYESNGHPLRDSDSIRLIGYVRASGTLYATDGCNSCRHRPDKRLEDLEGGELESTFSGTQLPVTMVEELARHVSAPEERRARSN